MIFLSDYADVFIGDRNWYYDARFFLLYKYICAVPAGIGTATN